jgi:DNA polymerase-3 subunit epsilon
MGWWSNWRFERQAEKLARSCRVEPMRSFLRQPSPDPRAAFAAIEFLAVDLETTGLDPELDHIVSLGWVRIAGARVLLGTARHLIVRSTRPMNQSAVIHGLFDTVVRSGVKLEEALAALLNDLVGRVLVVHHAPMDRGFLDRACKHLYGVPLWVRTVDTLALEKHRRSRREQSLKSGALRLNALREAYNLPRYPAHNALLDAISTAELLLAMARRNEGKRGLRLDDLLS